MHMDIIELRSALHELIDRADENELNVLKAILEKMEVKNQKPELLQALLDQSRKEYEDEDTFEHESVMREVRIKYGFEE